MDCEVCTDIKTLKRNRFQSIEMAEISLTLEFALDVVPLPHVVPFKM
jgi:hypothetical protein